MEPFIASFLGAAIQELLHWIDLKQELGGDVKITRSKDYWLITIVAILLFTVATPYIIDGLFDSGKNETWHYIVTSFAFPAVLRKLTKIILKSNDAGSEPDNLGTQGNTRFKLKNYFNNF